MKQKKMAKIIFKGCGVSLITPQWLVLGDLQSPELDIFQLLGFESVAAGGTGS